MKLQSNELRCTNLVTDYKGLESYKIGELYYGDEDHQTGVAWNIDTPIKGISIERFEPITLTEEWLLKFNGVCHPWGWVINDILIHHNYTMPKGRMFWIELGNGKRIDLPYVHTLQNFFVLTGDELTCKD